MIEKTLKVPDMSCGHCKAAVEGELNKLSGVERANADLGRGTVAISYDESSIGTEDDTAVRTSSGVATAVLSVQIGAAVDTLAGQVVFCGAAVEVSSARRRDGWLSPSASRR